MDAPKSHFWRLRLDELKTTLEKNHFEAHVVSDAQAAKQLCLEQIIPAAAPGSIAWGGSMTYTASGLYDAIKARDDLNFIDTFEKGITAAENLERRRQALLADLFITGSNAVTEKSFPNRRIKVILINQDLGL